MEQVIGDGADALNAYISSGEIEELRDVVPPPSSTPIDVDEAAEDNGEGANEDGGDESPDSKRQKLDRVVNHNAQIVYSNDAHSQSGIPSLMTIDVKCDVPYKNASGHPPSLLNLNVAPPFDETSGSSSGWQPSRTEYSRSGKDGPKRRNRDSDGNRISRFDRESGSGTRSSRFENNDNNGSRNRRSGNSSSGSSRPERSSGRSNRRI